MDAGNIIYLIAIIIYFIYTAVKKGKNEGLPENMDKPERGEQQRKPVSFEDLLKEIRQGQQRSQGDFQPTEQRKPIEVQENQRQVRQFETNPRTYQPQKVKQPKAYEQFQGEVAERERPKLLTLDEQVRLTGSIEGIKSSLQTELLEKERHENKYANLLRNPQSVKDAIILSEILNRKHF
ncbi:hypothetical protein [Shivajiella indica]|uniref:Uncharacterized protein n=1 Tax=Shivajiella indica TaxID=872115 RepID=A0ABW5B4R9_9BACT